MKQEKKLQPFTEQRKSKQKLKFGAVYKYQKREEIDNWKDVPAISLEDLYRQNLSPNIETDFKN